MNLSYFGLHSLEGIRLLAQQSGVINIDAPSLNLNNMIKTAKGHCPHEININLPDPDQQTLNWFGEHKDHPLVSVFTPSFPANRGPSLLVDDSPLARSTLLLLQQLGSPCGAKMLPLWAIQPKKILGLLEVTNISPLVIFGMDFKLLNLSNKIMEAAAYSTRRVIALGPSLYPERPDLRRVSLETLSINPNLQLKELGSYLIRRNVYHAV